MVGSNTDDGREQIMNESNGNLEQISELMDGRLHAGALVDAVHQACTEPAAAQAWRSYHLVGDVLRSPDLGLGHDPDFLRRLRVRLDEQPVAGPAQASESTMPVAGQAANADFFCLEEVGRMGRSRSSWRVGMESGVAVGDVVGYSVGPRASTCAGLADSRRAGAHWRHAARPPHGPAHTGASSIRCGFGTAVAHGVFA